MATPTESQRLAVGIDLGTTHTVVAWAPLDGSTPPRIFPIPQLVTTSEVAARPLLSSFLYAPIPGEVAADPWGPPAVGPFGSQTPKNVIAPSAVMRIAYVHMFLRSFTASTP